MPSRPDFRNKEALTLHDRKVVTLHKSVDLHFDAVERS